jgi:hypothetical protein
MGPFPENLFIFYVPGNLFVWYKMLSSTIKTGSNLGSEFLRRSLCYLYLLLSTVQLGGGGGSCIQFSRPLAVKN